MAKAKVAPAPGAAIIFAPKTDQGAGILPLLFRSILRALMLAYVNYMKWAMTVEQAHAEITDALNAYDKAIGNIPKALISDTTNEWFTIYRNELLDLRDKLAAASTTNPDATIEPHAEQVRHLLNSTLALLSKLDNELFGLKGDATDPGKLL
jgi:hypothetical protein